MSAIVKNIENELSGMERSEEIDVVDPERELTPKRIVAELDRYVIAQEEAKRAVAIALRNRWRRLRVSSDMRDEITPKNIIMIGPTGVGKTEISRRLAKLTRAPFVKVEASKFTEVGYVGRDVESIIRDLVEVSVGLVKKEERLKNLKVAEERAEERLLDVLLPARAVENSLNPSRDQDSLHIGFSGREGIAECQSYSGETKEKLRVLLRQGKLDERVVEIETQKQVNTHLEILGPPGFAEVEGQLKDMFTNLIPKKMEKKKVSVAEARKAFIEEEQENLLEPESIGTRAVIRAEQRGIIFIDEIDKICGGEKSQRGGDVSREGVQRDLLPIVEGSTVNTKYGPVKTDHMLFIASGAFHYAKPSDLMPEFQGRFPIRVELKSLTSDDFVRILQEPQNALLKQYEALLASEGVQINFTKDAIEAIARLTAEVNERTEDIGARRLHTLLERVLSDLSFEADGRQGDSVQIDRNYVHDQLAGIVKNEDLSRFIL